MIKILFFIETLSGGGAEKVLQNLVNNMDNEKFDITVQTVWKENTEGLLNKNIRYKYIYPYYSKINNYKYYDSPSRNNNHSKFLFTILCRKSRGGLLDFG